MDIVGSRGTVTASRARAVSTGLIGESEEIDDHSVAALIFQPGFSTSTESGPDAGRGMGMNVIKQRIVDESGGEIAVSSEPGRYCEFTFTLPAAVQYAVH